MTKQFNLLDEKWIPAVHADGHHNEFSVYDLLAQAQQLTEVRCDSPLETVAIYRVLLAILHQIFGPPDRQTWLAMWNDQSFELEAVRRGLGCEEIYSRFNLFAEDNQYPFLQSCHVVTGEKPVITLSPQLASGNNSTLFDHHTEDVEVALSPAEAARALLSGYYFGFSGTSGTGKNFEDAPCAKGALFLIEGSTLFETLMLNLIIYSGDKPLPKPTGRDSPAWSQANPFLPKRKAPTGYLDYLTWPNRHIRLLPNENSSGKTVVKKMKWAPALALDKNAEIFDPMKHYCRTRDKKKWYPFSFTPERALWRDSATLFQFAGGYKPPLAVKHVTDLALSRRSRRQKIDERYMYQLRAFGLAKDKANPEFIRTEKIPTDARYLENPNNVSGLASALALSEKVGKLVVRSAFLLAWLAHAPKKPQKEFDDFDKPFNEQELIDGKISKGKQTTSRDREAQQVYDLYTSFGVETLYWSRLEVHFYRLLHTMPDDKEGANREWQRQLRFAARAAFEQARMVAGVDLRTHRALAQASNYMEKGVNLLLYTGNGQNSTEEDNGS